MFHTCQMEVKKTLTQHEGTLPGAPGGPTSPISPTPFSPFSPRGPWGPTGRGHMRSSLCDITPVTLRRPPAHQRVLGLLAAPASPSVPGIPEHRGYREHLQLRLALGTRAGRGRRPPRGSACETCSRPSSLGEGPMREHTTINDQSSCRSNIRCVRGGMQ